MRPFLLLCSLVFAAECVAAAPETNSGILNIGPPIEAAIQAGEMPGAVVLVGTKDKILHRRAYGQRQVQPVPEAMTLDTIFDLASLTKPVATATSVMLLAERGMIDVTLPVSHYLPEFGQNGKEQVTIHHLLTHTSGLIADNSLKDYTDGKPAAWANICQLRLTAAVGERFIYSDVGFITLGFLIEKVSENSLNEWTQQQIFERLGMSETGYLPADALKPRIAPMDRHNGDWLRGTVHDPRAALMGGVAGHAGLFSTADDLSLYAQALLNRGEGNGNKVLSPETVDLMLLSRPVPGPGIRTWGWDRQTGFSVNRGQGMSEQAIGHGGFTGTGLWIDPSLNLYVIFLSNRLHPDGKGAVNKLIGEIGTIAVQSLKQQ